MGKTKCMAHFDKTFIGGGVQVPSYMWRSVTPFSVKTFVILNNLAELI
jgi:hypothetical protein